MASETNKKMMEEEADFELPVSMIDVVFLLLIFFMCASKFKTMEQRLDANLPKDEGQNPIQKKVEKPQEIRIKIQISKQTGNVEILAQDYPCRDLNDLAKKLKTLSQNMPGLPVIIDGRQKVPFYVILGALDACARADLKDVKFQAPPVAGGGGSDYWYE
jgi:biopolymer transport protein ExbD